MGKKKKKAIKQTAGQRLRARLSAGAQKARLSAAAAGERLQTGRNACMRRFSAFVALKWSAAPLAVLMFGLTMLVYYINGKLYLTSSVFMYFPSTVTYHLFDYSLGFISRALVGDIIMRFTDTVSVALVLALSRVTVFTLFILQSVVAALVFKKAFLNRSYIICAAAVAFVSSPITVLSFVYNLGLLDQYNLVLAVLCLYVADTKAGVVLTPVLCVLGMLVHHEFGYALLPAVLLVLLYYICAEKRLRRARIACLTVTACACGALAAYFLLFEKNSISLTEPEMYAYLTGKFREADSIGIYTDYYVFYFYGKDGGNYPTLLSKIGHLIDLAFSRIKPVNELRLFGVMLPFYALLEYFWLSGLRHAEKGKRLPYLGFMLLPLVRVGTFLISDDLLRFADEAYLSSFLVFAAAVKKNDPHVNGAVHALQKRLDRPWKRGAAAGLFAAYVVTAVLLYTVFLH